MRIRVTIFVLLLLPVVSLAQSSPWSIEKLVGMANTHAGPDCHSATLVGKGYEDELLSVTEKGLRFYLERFCTLSTKPAAAGDIIVVHVPDHFDSSQVRIVHSMLSIGNGLIFEKESGGGLRTPKHRMSPYFQKKKFEDSFYFQTKEKNGYSFSTYSCADAKTVRKELRTCEIRAEEIGIAMISKEMEKMAFGESADLHLSTEALVATHRVAEFMEKIKRPDPCLDYFAARIDSVESSVRVLESIGGEYTSKEWTRFPQRSEWIEATSRLSMSSTIARSQVEYFLKMGYEVWN